MGKVCSGSSHFPCGLQILSLQSLINICILHPKVENNLTLTTRMFPKFFFQNLDARFNKKSDKVKEAIIVGNWSVLHLAKCQSLAYQLDDFQIHCLFFWVIQYQILWICKSLSIDTVKLTHVFLFDHVARLLAWMTSNHIKVGWQIMLFPWTHYMTQSSNTNHRSYICSY